MLNFLYYGYYGGYYGYGFDWTYLVLVMPCILLSLWVMRSVQ